MLLHPKSPLLVRLSVVSGILLMLGVLFAQFTSNVPGDTDAATKINLALRRTADRLLRAAGDSTSRIPVVQQLNERTYRVALSSTFDYDKLPGLLQQSLQMHQVAGAYDVAVLDCPTGELQLGYSVKDLAGDEPVPCTGRSLTAGCYLLQITFTPAASTGKQTPLWPFLAGGGLLAGLLFMIWRQSAQVRPSTGQPIADAPATTAPATNQLRFGQSCLDLGSQTLLAGPDEHKLTYREAKLLRLLVNHPNQVLERDQILKLVWEDEGITVGRSLDVFISRLRKLLHNDPTIKIAAVHGVGYKLEVQELANS